MNDTRNLTFNDATLRVIERDGEPWITSTDLARALGYSRPDKIAQIYRRNAAEFTPSMTALIRIEQGSQPQFEVVTPHSNRQIDVPPSPKSRSQRQSGVVTPSAKQSDTRIFSLRGAHLIAMFAKTPIAAAFRRWVLDILDGWTAARAALPNPASSSPAQDVARLVEGHDVVVMRELGDALGLPVGREGYLWLAEVMDNLGFYNAWVRAESCPPVALPRRDLRRSDRGY